MGTSLYCLLHRAAGVYELLGKTAMGLASIGVRVEEEGERGIYPLATYTFHNDR